MNDDKKKAQEDHMPKIPKEFDQSKRKKYPYKIKGHIDEALPKPYEIPIRPNLRKGFKLSIPKINYTPEASETRRSIIGTFLLKDYSEMNLVELTSEKKKLEMKLIKIKEEIRKK
jgi:hypothetical protein